MEEFKMKTKAMQMAQNFIENEKEYQMGYISAEKANAKTKNMSQTFEKSIEEGVKLLLSCDEDLIKSFKDALKSEEYAKLKEDIYNTISGGGKVYFSGCGSSGRLCMRVEASFRAAMKKINPEYENSVEAIMTGGEFALIRAVESFEDYIVLGKRQVQKLGINEKDMLVGVTATGETTSILGTAAGALEANAKVCMVVCSDPYVLIDKMERAKIVYTNPATSVLLLESGKMALTGSTRMQASSIEQIVLCAAVDEVIKKIAGDDSETDYGKAFEKLIESMKSDGYIKCMAEEIAFEEDARRKNRFVTYFANEYILDVLTDTTERAPTFNSPKFRPNKRHDMPLSWEFAKNPEYGTKDAWFACFGREPRCIDWDMEEYISCGIELSKKPEIDLDALYQYEIGNEHDPEREGEGNVAIWIGFDKSEKFDTCAANYGMKHIMISEKAAASLVVTKTYMDIFEHIAMKITMNTVSTAVMARIGRIWGNYMIYLDISNKKLVDRAARIIAELTTLPYDKALCELFYSQLYMEKEGIVGSAVQFTLERLKKEN